MAQLFTQNELDEGNNWQQIEHVETAGLDQVIETLFTSFIVCSFLTLIYHMMYVMNQNQKYVMDNRKPPILAY